MNSRRSLNDALQLNAEKLAFINGDSNDALITELGPSQAVDRGRQSGTKPTLQSTHPVSDTAMPMTATPVRPRKRVAKPSNPSQATSKSPPTDAIGMALANVLIPLTTRLQPDTALALKRASLEQRLRGSEPATVQEIVEEAVSQWLQTHGYLQPP